MEKERPDAPEPAAPPAKEPPWEVSEYRFEEPFWMRLLLSPWGGPPLIVLIGYGVWRIFKG